MSDSRWVTTPSWLSRSLRSFLYSSSMYSCHLFLSLLLLLGPCHFFFFVPILARNILLVSPIFLKQSLVFPFLLFCSIPLHCSLKKTFLPLFAVLWNPVFSWVYLFLSLLPFASLLFSSICKASSDHHFAFLHLFFFGMLLVTTSYTILWTSVHSPSGTLSTRSNPLNLFITSIVKS